MKTGRPKLAIIGTGIAGLTAASLLKNKFEVTVYESQQRAGMGVQTIDYESNGIKSRIDIPLRIFCQGYYDNLIALYDHIGVEILASDHAGAFVDGENKMILHYGNVTLGERSVPYLRGLSALSPRAWGIAWQSHLFFNRAKKDIKNPKKWADMTFGAYLDENQTGRAFVDTILLPMMSVTCTCNYASVLNYPADIMLDYVTCGVTEFGIMSAEKGVDDIVTRLLDGVNLLTGSAISEIMAAGEQLRITVANGDVQFYDQVVVATQAHQAAAMLSGFNTQKELLETVPIEMSEMSVHTDTDILPYSNAPLSPVSYHVPEGAERAEVSVDLTKAIPRFGGQERVFQTWNPIRKISPNRELARAKFTRPLVTHESRKAITSLRKYQQRDGNRLWFTGSYMADKIPLLDAAVDSTVLVAEQLGVEIPWKSDRSA